MKNFLWNMFANIKNGQIAKRKFIIQKRKKICEDFLQIMWNEGFISGYSVDLKDSNQLKIYLKYYNEKPAISNIKLISKPSRRIFWSVKQIWKIDSEKNFIIFSTSKGLMTTLNCKKYKIGGEPFVLIF